MRRTILLSGVVALVLGLVPMSTPLSAAAADPGGEAIRFSAAACWVAWSPETEAAEVTDWECWGINVRTADGRYLLVLHGQIPEEWMSQFIADGRPAAYATTCMFNFGFWRESGMQDPMVFGESVRRFTRNGAMVETCVPPVAES